MFKAAALFSLVSLVSVARAEVTPVVPAFAPTPAPSSPSVAQEPTPRQPRARLPSFTFEAGFGVALPRDGLAAGGPTLGVGAFVHPRIAVTARLAGVTYFATGGPGTQPDEERRHTGFHGFVGPAVQLWATDRLWAGGGIGIGRGTLGVTRRASFAYGFRGGTTLRAGSTSDVNLSLEFTSNGDGETLAALLGFQYGRTPLR